MKIGMGMALGMLGGGVMAVYSISGVVYDADGLTAVSEATVTLGALSAVSVANGSYTISDVPAGTSGSMTCSKTGYSWPIIPVLEMVADLTAQNFTNAWWAASGVAASCLGAYRAIGAPSLAGSYTNLANPGVSDLNTSTAPTFAAATGWTFNGSTQYLKTGIVPTVNHTSLIRTSAFAVGAYCIFGIANGGNLYRMLPNLGGNRYYQNGASSNFATVETSGVFCFAGKKPYLNGIYEGLDISAGAMDADVLDVYIGAANNGGSPVTHDACVVQGYAHYNTTLSASQVAAVSLAMAALP